MKKFLFMRILPGLGLLMLLSAGCDERFEEINTDTNFPVEVNPGVLLRNALFKTASDGQFLFWDFDGFVMQYYEFITAASASTFNWSPATGERIWEYHYKTLTDVEDVLRKSEALGDDSYRAAALILKSYLFSVLVDNFGDIPYSQALQARYTKNFFPVYDEQKAIYRDLIAKLDTANSLLSEDAAFVYGGDEALFGGDPIRWKKFANALRLRLLLRVSALPEFNAPAEIAEMLADPAAYPLPESNADDVSYLYSGTVPHVNPISTYRDWEYESNVPTLQFIERLKALRDPRIGAYFWPTPASRTDSLSYEGIPSAITGDSLSSYSASNLSVSNQDLLRKPTTPTTLISYAEVEFILAEAALKGYIADDAAARYEAGVRASFEAWEADSADAYLAQPAVAFDGSLSKIIEQKYIAFYQVAGQQAWAEYRRTGFPALVGGPNSVNGGQIPQRLMYPSLEQTLNGAQLAAAVARMGGTDDINQKLFWAK